jgi:hypothetical protein
MNKLPKLKIYACIFMLLAVSAAVPARADLVIEVGVGSAIGGTSFDVRAGESIDLDLYITQTSPTVRLDSEAKSINSAEVLLSLTGGNNLTFSPPVTFSNFFADPTSLTQIEDARLYFSAGSTKTPSSALGGEIPGVLASEDGVDDDSLRLGTFRLQADLLASGLYTVDLQAGMAGGFNGTTTPDTPFTGVALTPGSFRINVSAIPEPSSLLLLGSITTGSLFFRRRRAVAAVAR